MMPIIRAKTILMEKMAKGDTPLGIFVSSLDPAATEVLGDAGFDFVMLDGEHGRLGRIEVEHHARAAEVNGTIPFVRVLENSPTLIQAMLDGGAQGVMVPHVDTADDARRAVEASLYSPVGQRGMCPACHAGRYTLKDWQVRWRQANENVVVIPIIESRKSVENIAEIVAVDGIDLVMFGPGDLSADMGIDLSTELHRLTEAWRRVLAATRAAGKRLLAPHGFGYDEADMLIVEMDLMLLHRAASGIVAEHKASLRRVSG
jgi:4-hydroxy-2-oxoheptanedioate aldolase